MQYMYQYKSPLGEITMESDGTALTGLWLEGQRDFSSMQENLEEKELQIFKEVKCWLDIYFQGEEPDFLPQLSYEGSSFRKTVWDILLTIPYGQTMTYGDIAKRIAEMQGIEKMSAQAVGGAVGSNPISIIVPCHRVIGAGGKLTGYAGGLDKKVKLLQLERVL
jgi:methylated-DNA-[protein]-cysteine S-methyltransferase